MADPWFDPLRFGIWYGALGGGAGGLCGVLGAMTGFLAPRGIGRMWVLGAFYLMTALGIGQLIFGMYAYFADQPWGIWYGPVLCDGILTAVMGSLTPMVRYQYRQAEERRLEAEALRNS